MSDTDPSKESAAGPDVRAIRVVSGDPDDIPYARHRPALGGRRSSEVRRLRELAAIRTSAGDAQDAREAAATDDRISTDSDLAAKLPVELAVAAPSVAQAGPGQSPTTSDAATGTGAGQTEGANANESSAPPKTAVGNPTKQDDRTQTEPTVSGQTSIASETNKPPTSNAATDRPGQDTAPDPTMIACSAAPPSSCRIESKGTPDRGVWKRVPKDGFYTGSVVYVTAIRNGEESRFPTLSTGLAVMSADGRC